MQFNVHFLEKNDNIVKCMVVPTRDPNCTLELEEVYFQMYGEEPCRDKYIKDFYTGIATRNKEDDINIELAECIARRKAYRAAYKAYRYYNYELLRLIRVKLVEIECAVGQLTNKVNCLTKEIKEISK